MAVERIAYEDTPAFEREFEAPSGLASVVENFDASGQPLEPVESAEPWVDDVDELEGGVDFDGGADFEGVGEGLPLDLMALSAEFQSLSPNQQQAFVADLSEEQQQELVRQFGELQVEQKLERLASFHENRNAYEAERQAVDEQQRVEAETRGLQVFDSMLEAARKESRAAAPTEELGDLTRGYLDFAVSELVGQGYDQQTAAGFVFTPENIEATVREVAKQSAQQESIRFALGHLRAR